MSQQPKPTQSPSNPVIDRTKITPLQTGGWQGLDSVIGLLEEEGAKTAGQKKLTDQQVAVIDGQRQINGALVNATQQILTLLGTLPISADAKTEIDLANGELAKLLGRVPPGCQQGG